MAEYEELRLLGEIVGEIDGLAKAEGTVAVAAGSLLGEINSLLHQGPPLAPDVLKGIRAAVELLKQLVESEKLVKKAEQIKAGLAKQSATDEEREAVENELLKRRQAANDDAAKMLDKIAALGGSLRKNGMS